MSFTPGDIQEFRGLWQSRGAHGDGLPMGGQGLKVPWKGVPQGDDRSVKAGLGAAVEHTSSKSCFADFTGGLEGQKASGRARGGVPGRNIIAKLP